MSSLGNYRPAKQKETTLGCQTDPLERHYRKTPKIKFAIHIHPSEDGPCSSPTCESVYQVTVLCTRNPLLWLTSLLVRVRFTLSSEIIRDDFAFLVSRLEEHKGAQCGPAAACTERQRGGGAPRLPTGAEQQKPPECVEDAEDLFALVTYRVAARISQLRTVRWDTILSREQADLCQAGAGTFQTHFCRQTARGQQQGWQKTPGEAQPSSATGRFNHSWPPAAHPAARTPPPQPGGGKKSDGKSSRVKIKTGTSLSNSHHGQKTQLGEDLIYCCYGLRNPQHFIIIQTIMLSPDEASPPGKGKSGKARKPRG